MDLKKRLSERIHLYNIHEIVCLIQGNERLKQKLYDLLFDSDETVSYQTAWVFTHLNREENKWLYTKQDELINEAMLCRHPGRKRLLLCLINNQPLHTPIRIDFLDFCLDQMSSKDELPAVKSVCIKLGYKLCRSTPELLQEFKTLLEIMEPDLLAPAVRSIRNNTLKDLKRKS